MQLFYFLQSGPSALKNAKNWNKYYRLVLVLVMVNFLYFIQDLKFMFRVLPCQITEQNYSTVFSGL